MAQDGFAQMIDDSTVFFSELRANNTKEWFEPRKDHYVQNIRKPAEFLAEQLAEDLSRIAGQTLKPKVFRIYRDVRFSKDKTPYKDHLHMLWSPVSEDPLAPVFFFGTEPGEQVIGYGVPSMAGPALARYRAFVDGWGDDLEAAIAGSGFGFSRFGADPLKRVPKPFDSEHPHGDLLRRKSMVLTRDITTDWRDHPGGLIGAVRAGFEQAAPLRELIAAQLLGG